MKSAALKYVAINTILCLSTIASVHIPAIASASAAVSFAELRSSAKATLNKVSQDNPPNDDEVQTATQLVKVTTVLRDKQRESQEEVPNYYLDTIKYATELLKQSIMESNRAKRKAILIDVLADLTVKATQAQSGAQGSEGLGASVTVSVKTVKNGTEVGGFYVRCNPRRYDDQKHPMFPFNNLSSPAVRKLPPGNFQMWLEKGDLVTKPVFVSIGGDGESAETVTLQAP